MSVQVRRFSFSIGAFVAALSVGSPSYAGDPAAAEALFNEARSLVGRGDYEQACPKFEESQRLDAGMGTLYNLGDCYEHVGKTASAWAAFREVAAAASAAGQQAREVDARARAAALEPKLVTLTIDVSPPAKALSNLVVKRDNVEVGRAQWGSAIPIDPGKHLLVATAEAKEAWQSEVVVSDAVRSTNVLVPALKSAAAPPPAKPHPIETGSSGGWSTQRTIGVIVGGVGIVGLGLGSVFGLRSMSRHDDDQLHCDSSSSCDPQGFRLRNEARDAGTISTVGFIAGGILVAGGITLFLTAPRASRTTTAPAVGLGPGSVTLKGAF
jgi:hypothetical protein